MTEEFKRALSKVLVHEGGYVNHPKDPGGATNKGITQRVYDVYRRKSGHSIQSVRHISDQEVENIYFQNYWKLAKCDQMPSGVGYVVFDGAVNSGVQQSVKWLQRALNVNADGQIGMITLNALAAYPDHDALVDLICDRRLSFLKALKTWNTFKKGWLRRVEEVRSIGKAWATGRLEQPIVRTEGTSVKADISDAKKAPSTAVGDATIGAGTISVVISQAQEQLAPLVSNPFAAKVMVILTVAGVAVAVGGMAYRVWATYKAKRLAEALGT